MANSVSSCGALRIAPWRWRQATEMKPQKGEKFQNGDSPGAAKFFVWELGKTNNFWQLVGGGGPHELASKKAKMTELSMFSSISFCGTLRFALCLIAFLLVAHSDCLLGH